MVRMIGIDLDDTYLNSEKNVPAENSAAVSLALDRGILVLPVTGRPPAAVPETVLRSAPFRYLIASGGASAHDLLTGELLFREAIPYETGLRLAAGLQEAGFLVNVFADGRGYVSERDYELAVSYARTPAAREYLRTFRVPVRDIFDIVRAHPEGLEKITAAAPRNEAGQMLRADEALRIAEPFSADIDVMYSPEINVEINSARATKGRAMLRIAHMYGIAREEIMAIGDSANDLEMIRTAGVPVAMGNACAELRAEARCIAPDQDHAGVAYAIRKWALGHV